MWPDHYCFTGHYCLQHKPCKNGGVLILIARDSAHAKKEVWTRKTNSNHKVLNSTVVKHKYWLPVVLSAVLASSILDIVHTFVTPCFSFYFISLCFGFFSVSLVISIAAVYKQFFSFLNQVKDEICTGRPSNANGISRTSWFTWFTRFAINSIITRLTIFSRLSRITRNTSTRITRRTWLTRLAR